MFVAIGLVFGTLTGFMTSLFRARSMSAMLILSNCVGLVLAAIFLGAIAFTKSVKQGGDVGTALATMIALGVGALIVVFAIGLVFGFLLQLVNGESFVKNARTTIIDVATLSLVFIIGQAFILNPISLGETSSKKSNDSEIRGRIELLHSQMPPQYQGMSPSGILDQAKQSSSTPVPNDIVQKATEIQSLEGKLVNDYGLAQFNRNNVRRETIFCASIVGWLISIFVVPLWLKRRRTSTNNVQQLQ